MFNGVPYLVGYLILSYAHYAWTATIFKTLLLTGRFISGLGMGWASTVVSVSRIGSNPSNQDQLLRTQHIRVLSNLDTLLSGSTSDLRGDQLLSHFVIPEAHAILM